MRNLEEFNGTHSDSPVFIIGAGTSIHFQDLEPLRNHITIAVNSGYVAAPWANYFVSDDWSIAHWSYFYDSLRSSSSTIALLYENKLLNTASWFGDRSVIFRHRKGIHIPDSYSHDNHKLHLGETRTSLGTAIMIAHIMGGSEIILLGLDGCRSHGKRYFWQLSHHLSPVRDAPYVMPRRNDRMPIDKYQKCRFKGQITDRDLVEINKTWQNFGDAVNQKCIVYNASDRSTITVFKKVNLERYIEDCG